MTDETRACSAQEELESRPARSFPTARPCRSSTRTSPLPINAAVAANVLSDDAVAYAEAPQQTTPTSTRRQLGGVREIDQNDQELSQEELEEQAGEELPDREAMSLINANVAAPGERSRRGERPLGRLGRVRERRAGRRHRPEHAERRHADDRPDEQDQGSRRKSSRQQGGEELPDREAMSLHQRQPRGAGQRGRRGERPVGQLGRVRERRAERRHRPEQLGRPPRDGGRRDRAALPRSGARPLTTTPSSRRPSHRSAPRPASGRRQRAPSRGAAKLADGVELLGEYEDSGFKEPHVHRPPRGRSDDPALAPAVPRRGAGGRHAATTARSPSGRARSSVARSAPTTSSSWSRRSCARSACSPTRDGSSPELKKPDPLLALKFRAALVPAPR